MKLYITFPNAIPLIISVHAMPNFCQTQIGRDRERVIMSVNNEGGTSAHLMVLEQFPHQTHLLMQKIPQLGFDSQVENSYKKVIPC